VVELSEWTKVWGELSGCDVDRERLESERERARADARDSEHDEGAQPPPASSRHNDRRE
jgi:hypothetical protein